MLLNYRLKLLFVPLLAGLAFSQSNPPAPANTGITETAAPATAAKPFVGKTCDELKSEIDAKLKAKGVKIFTLDIVGKDDVKDAKVVGSCEGGSKKITYKRG